jgi:hypothetical protein
LDLWIEQTHAGDQEEPAAADAARPHRERTRR